MFHMMLSAVLFLLLSLFVVGVLRPRSSHAAGWTDVKLTFTDNKKDSGYTGFAYDTGETAAPTAYTALIAALNAASDGYVSAIQITSTTTFSAAGELPVDGEHVERYGTLLLYHSPAGLNGRRRLKLQVLAIKDACVYKPQGSKNTKETIADANVTAIWDGFFAGATSLNEDDWRLLDNYVGERQN